MNIELPVNFLYLYKHLAFGGGPNFSYGFNGRLKTNDSERDAFDPGESFERTISANYSPGFTNIYKGDGSAPSNIKAHTQMLGISVGYMFGVMNDQ
jgi:hypothetical protein